MIRIPNEMIACEPFESLAVQTQGKAFVIVKQKNSLYATKVVYMSIREFTTGNLQAHPYQPGHTVYLRGDAMTMPWSREVLELGGKKVILVPCSHIQAWEFPGYGEQ